MKQVPVLYMVLSIFLAGCTSHETGRTYGGNTYGGGATNGSAAGGGSYSDPVPVPTPAAAGYSDNPGCDKPIIMLFTFKNGYITQQHIAGAFANQLNTCRIRSYGDIIHDPATDNVQMLFQSARYPNRFWSLDFVSRENGRVKVQGLPFRKVQ